MKSLKAMNPATLAAVLAFAASGVMASHVPGYADVMEGMDLDVRAGVYTDAEGFAIGGGLLTPIGSGTGWFFNPNVEVAMPDGDNVLTINGDFHYDFPAGGSISPYIGAGPAVLRHSGDTDFGLNLFGGLSALQGSVRPFVQMKGVVADRGDLALMGGLRF